MDGDHRDHERIALPGGPGVDAGRQRAVRRAPAAAPSSGCNPTARRRSCRRTAAARTGSPSAPTARCTCATAAATGSHDMGGLTIPDSYLPGTSLGRPHRARRPRHRRGHRAVPRVRRAPADRARTTSCSTTTGGFWFTDHGRWRERDKTHGGALLRAPDGSEIREVVYPLDGPNGVGLSPDGNACLRGGDVHGPAVRLGPRRAGRGRGTGATRRQRRRARLRAARGCSSSTPSPSTATATSWSATLVNGGLTVIAPDGSNARARAVPRPDGDQRLLRRRRPAHRVRDLLGDGQARVGAVALAGPEARVLALWSHLLAQVLQPTIVSIRGRGNPGPCWRCPRSGQIAVPGAPARRPLRR